MGKHSRNNTNASSFTYAERQMLGAGTKQSRLGRDSMLNFDDCALCLERARDGRACTEGHIYCYQCILSNLISQKQAIKSQQRLLVKIQEEEQDTLRLARQAARERVLSEFNQAQSGLSISKTSSAAKKLLPSISNTTTVAPSGEDGKKRKFNLDQEEIERLINVSEEEAMNRTALELIESRRAKLPAFWLPSLTPSTPVVQLTNTKLQTLCTVTPNTHPCSLKSLLPVKFTEDITSEKPAGERPIICPVCRKSLSNNVKSFLIKNCACVLCEMCVDTLCRPESTCANCNTPFPPPLPSSLLSTSSSTSNDPKRQKKEEVKRKEKQGAQGMIELRREGTGFAAGGMAETKRFDLAFQG